MESLTRVGGVVLTAVALALSAGCARKLPITSGSGPPATTHQIEFVVERGPYLDALLSRGDTRLRFFFDADDPQCQAVIRTEAAVRYDTLGPYGRVLSDAGECSPIGIASLREWMRRRPRPRTQSVAPRGRADYRIAYEDEELALLRGRFPLSGLVGWAGGNDTLAIVEKTEICAPVLARGQSSIEFRAAGAIPLRFVTNDGPCPLTGFVQPMGELR